MAGKSVDMCLDELHEIITDLGGGSVSYDGAGYRVTLHDAKYYGTYYADSFPGIKQILKNLTK